MKVSFSTLACPTWTLPQVIEIAVSSGYEGVELRFLEGEDSLWRLPALQGSALALSKRMICDNGLAITCVGTSCRFHSPDRTERERWIEEGKRSSLPFGRATCQSGATPGQERKPLRRLARPAEPYLVGDPAQHVEALQQPALILAGRGAVAAR